MPDLSAVAPFIVTLALDPALEQRFERDRQAWFPARLNQIPAHVSMFHHLPGDEHRAVVATIEAVCGSTAPFPVEVTGPIGLGRGTAYRLRCPDHVHRTLSAQWRDWLTAQDRQSWRPHVTIQNKVDPAEARALLARLMDGFVPFGGLATGIRLWRYLGGPWSLVQETPFTG